MDQVHFAFRAQGATWEGGHSTYAVRVEADGFSVTPYHFPREQLETAGGSRSSLAQREARKESPDLKSVEGAPLRFGAARVTRGGTVMASQKPEGRVKDSGDLTLTRGIVAEHFRNSKDGVEQSWSFEQKLEGSGALEVRVPVKSGRFLGETDQGLHFADGTTGLGVRYSHGTWVDAEGHRTPVPARFEAGSIVLRVPTEVVDASPYPAVLDPTVSPEFGMDNPVNGPADSSQYSPAVTYNGTNFLVVWNDYRSGSDDIYGTRVDGTGSVLDISGIRISSARSFQYSPEVAHDGTNFLVVWHDYRNGSPDIYGARVSGTGAVLDTDGIPISTATDIQSFPTVAHDGTNFLVVWQDYRSGTGFFDIYGARITGAGTVLDLSGIPISTATNDQKAPSVAHNGTNFLVVWQDYRSGTGFSDIYGTRVSSAGSVLNTNGIIISNALDSQEYPSVAYNGMDFVVVWEDYRNRSSTSADIYGARVSGTGVVRNPNGIPIVTATSDQRYPALAREGTNCLIVWQDYRNSSVYAARIDSTGTVLDTTGILISSAYASWDKPAVAHDGTNFLVVWPDYSSPNSPNIYGARVSNQGAIISPGNIPISKSANGQYTPAVAHDGTNFLVVWVDMRNGRSDIYGARVSETGSVLDTSGIPISTISSYKSLPAIAHDGTNFLIVWQDYRNGYSDIYGARVSSSGTLLDTTNISISTAANDQYNPAVIHNGVNFLVVWHDSRSGTNYDIYGARVNSSGTVLDTTGIAISAATGDQYAPKVAQDGANFLVVWDDSRSGTNRDIYGARVTNTGALLDTSGIAISNLASSQYSPSVAHNGIHFLVVWEDYRSGSPDIYGARVDGAGAVLDTSGIAISSATSSQYAPSVAYDGTNFLVVWQDYRSGTGFSDIYGARLNETGTVLDTSGLPISTEPANEMTPRITSMGGESSLVVYRGSHASTTTNSERVLARFVQFP